MTMRLCCICQKEHGKPVFYRKFKSIKHQFNTCTEAKCITFKKVFLHNRR